VKPFLSLAAIAALSISGCGSKEPATQSQPVKAAAQTDGASAARKYISDIGLLNQQEASAAYNAGYNTRVKFQRDTAIQIANEWEDIIFQHFSASEADKPLYAKRYINSYDKNSKDFYLAVDAYTRELQKINARFELLSEEWTHRKGEEIGKRAAPEYKEKREFFGRQ
jgi:predicted DNA-binding protein